MGSRRAGPGGSEPDASPPARRVIADAVVCAAGASRRMGGIDKLTVPLAGRPVLAWSLAAIAAARAVERIVLVVARDRVEEVRRAGWLPAAVVSVVAGGERRQESVAAGLAELDRLDRSGGPEGASDDERIVLVHDGARPLVGPELVDRVAEAAAAHGAAIPVVPIGETVKRIAGDRVEGTVDRTGLALAQTPQGVRRGLLRAAFARFPPDGPETWTDEAALLEACRIAVHAIPGEASNLKVTVPDDLVRAEALVALRTPPRPGLGVDHHPFGPGAPLVLGGVEIPGAPRLHGHSDGDVVLHAVADALLGAAALGDLGRLFPAGPETPAGIASRELLRGVLDRVREAGYRPVSVDVTIVGARPRLGPWLEPIRASLAALLGLDPAAVSVKASTGNLAGAEGAGRGLSAHAIAYVAGRP